MAELVSIKRNVDVSPGQAAPAVFHCSQGDVGSKIILGLLNNGTAYAIPSGVTVTIEGSESNGSIFTPISATASGSDITFYLTGEMTAVAGPTICQAVLKSGSNILGTANFTLEVESSPMGADAPPVFTDAGWTWMLNKLTTEFVPTLGDNIIDAIDGKADQSDLTALSNAKLDKNQGTTNAGKYLKVGANGNVETADLDVTTDKTLSIADKAADAKAVGDELDDLKANLTQDSNILNGENLIDATTIQYNNNSAVANNNDGTYTIGTTDYGVTTFGNLFSLQPGEYVLYGVPNGYSFLSTTRDTSGTFRTNTLNTPLRFTQIEAKECYLGFRIQAKPSSSFVITPYLKKIGVVADVNALKTAVDSLPELFFAVSHKKATTITAGADLNTYTTPGNFLITSSAIASQVSNTPTNEGGRVSVIETVGNANQIQFYILNSGVIYYRYHNASGWSEWSYIANKSHIQAVYNSPTFTGNPTTPTASYGTSTAQIASTQFVQGAVNGLGKPIATDASVMVQIAENSDLNDITTIGNYRINSSSIAVTVLHRPINDAGRLTVTDLGSPSTKMQIYISNSSRIYTRIYNALGWGDWVEIIRNTETYQNLSTNIERSNVASNGLYNIVKALEDNGIYDIRFANAPVQLGLKNYIGNTQNVHPKVLYFPSKFGNHYYWMAYTPYPNGNDVYENPCIAYSDDGYTWTNISGNPLDDPQGNGYNSDTHLVYRPDTSTLECWYRFVSDGDTRYETIYRQTTTDGVTWSAKELVFQSTTSGASHYLSPAIIWDGAKYQIWVVDSGSIKYYEALPSNITSWSLVKTYSITFTDNGETASPWHLDVIKDGNTYIMFVMCMVSPSPRDKWSLFITTSSDNLTYTTPTKVVQGSNNWDEYMYRSTIVKVDDIYRIYYSALTSNSVFGMGITESDSLVDFIGKLVF